MQTSTTPAPGSPAPAAPPAPPPPPAAVTQTTVGEAAPAPASALTTEQAALLRARREELTQQSRTVESRRNRLAEQLKSADAGARPGLEQRVGLLDQQLVEIERDIGQTNRALLGAPPPAPRPEVVEPRVFGGFTSEEATAMGTVFMLVVLMPLALAYARLLWKRATRTERAPVVLESPQSQLRLERVEQAVEAIAVEVERVSEGQRFVTKLLSEGRAGSPLGAAREREPVREPVRVEERSRGHQPS